MAKWRLVVDEKDLHDDAAHIYHRIIDQSEEYSHTTVLHDAVLGYQNMSLEAALELDPSSINMIDDCGCTPLHWAAWKNDISAVRILLSWKADLDLRDYEGRTALSIAVAATKLQCAEILIEAGADANAKDKWNWTPLFLATREQSLEMVKLLLNNGADPQEMDDDKDTALSSPIYARSVVENAVLVRMYAELASAGADMDFPNNDGRTPIMKAIRANKPGMFRALWLNGAGVDLIDLHGQSILHLAGMYSNLEILLELQMAEICVDPNLKDDQGQTAVDYFRERTNTPRHALKGDQTKPTEQEILDFEALIEKTRVRYDEWIGSKQA
jgi:ankyrin repeat protein